MITACKVLKVTIGGEIVTDYYDHEELLKLATPSELKRLFSLAAAGKLPGLPVNSHSEAFL